MELDGLWYFLYVVSSLGDFTSVCQHWCHSRLNIYNLLINIVAEKVKLTEYHTGFLFLHIPFLLFQKWRGLCTLWLSVHVVYIATEQYSKFPCSTPKLPWRPSFPSLFHFEVFPLYIHPVIRWWCACYLVRQGVMFYRSICITYKVDTYTLNPQHTFSNITNLPSSPTKIHTAHIQSQPLPAWFHQCWYYQLIHTWKLNEFIYKLFSFY